LNQALPATFGPWELLEVIGRGGMGEVYKARRIGSGRIVALKRIHPERQTWQKDLARFRRETEAATRLDHPNIVRVYEVGEHDGQPYLALECVPGGNLAERLAEAPLQPVVAAGLVEKLARAIDYAHKQGIVHRDLKPANILLESVAHKPEEAASDLVSLAASSGLCATGYGLPKITDFGLAKRLDPAVEAALTRTGDAVGTPAYMAPEQTRGQTGNVGAAADIYALGAVLYEALTGRPAFRGATVMDTLDLVRTQEPVPPSCLQPKVPRDLETICLKCLEKEPARRYSDAQTLAEDLRRFLAGERIHARPVSRVEHGWRWCRRRPVIAGLLAALVLVGLVGLTGVIWQWRRAEENACTARAKEAQSDRNLHEAQDALGDVAISGLWQLRTRPGVLAYRRNQIEQLLKHERRLLDQQPDNFKLQTQTAMVLGLQGIYLWDTGHPREACTAYRESSSLFERADAIAPPTAAPVRTWPRTTFTWGWRKAPWEMRRRDSKSSAGARRRSRTWPSGMLPPSGTGASAARLTVTGASETSTWTVVGSTRRVRGTRRHAPSSRRFWRGTRRRRISRTTLP
jgi:serine/threonine protein kinase